MSMTDELMGMADADKEANAKEERREMDIERADDELDIDEISFSDEGEITIEDLKTSPALKLAYCKYISQSNWLRWCLL